MLRRALLILATMSLGVLMLSGVALARDIAGTFGDDALTGTADPDRIYGLGGKDTIRGLAGNDDCYGGSGMDEVRCGDGDDRIDGGFGEDVLRGGGGDDTISAADGQADQVDCGPGDDTAYVDELDDYAANCENVFVAQEQQPSPSDCQNARVVLANDPLDPGDRTSAPFMTTADVLRVSYSVAGLDDTNPDDFVDIRVIEERSPTQDVVVQSVRVSQDTTGGSFFVDSSGAGTTFRVEVDAEPDTVEGAVTSSVTVEDCG